MNKNKIIKVKKIKIVHLKISNYSQKLNQNILAIKKILIVTIEKELICLYNNLINKELICLT